MSQTTNNWLEFVKFFHQKNPKLSYQQALQEASIPYNKIKQSYNKKYNLLQLSSSSNVPPPYNAPPPYNVLPSYNATNFNKEASDKKAAEIATQQRVEEEVRKRVEATMQREESRKAEEAKQLAKQKEKQDLDDFYREIYAKNSNLTLDAYKNDTKNYKRSLPFFKHILSLGEKILFRHQVSTPQNVAEIGLFLTNQNVYVLNYGKNNGENECYVLSVYTFDEPLNSKQAKMLYNHLNKHVPVAITTNFNQLISTDSQGFRTHNEWTSRQFEAVVRLIPGSFQNDDWRQLDGFFGVYYNEKTMEVDIFPGKVF